MVPEQYTLKKGIFNSENIDKLGGYCGTKKMDGKNNICA